MRPRRKTRDGLKWLHQDKKPGHMLSQRRGSMLIDAGLRTETPDQARTIKTVWPVQCSSTRGCVLKHDTASDVPTPALRSMLIDAGLRTETFTGFHSEVGRDAFNAHRRGVAY